MGVEQRRVSIDPFWDESTRRLATAINRWLDTANGVQGGRLWLLGDDGSRTPAFGVAAVSTGNYPFRVRGAGTNHVEVMHSNASTVGLRIQDSGLLTGLPATLTSTLSVTGTASFNGAVNLGDAAADAIQVTGTATFTPLATFTGGLTANAAVLMTSTLQVQGTASFDGTTNIGNATTDIAVVAGLLGIQQTTPLRSLHVVKSGATASTVTTGSNTNDAILVDAGTAASAVAAINFIIPSGSGFAVLKASTPTTITRGAIYWDDSLTEWWIDANSNNAIRVGSNTLGFFNTAAVAQPAAAAAATDLATAITLVNSLRTGLRAATGLGLFS